MTLRQSDVPLDVSGDVRITDFGLAVAIRDLDSIWSGSDERGDSVRWIAPEILDRRGDIQILLRQGHDQE